MTDSDRRNRLANEVSPYLLQHSGNPVDWYPWGREALRRARAEDLPIFLSIGYAACHWCHVMERESFEDETVAGLLNRHFVAIKVDREERPDIDAVYMAAVQALTGSGGWPLSVFITPDLQPFFGGTYFPPEPRWGRPSFRQILEVVVDAWRARRDEITASARELTDHLASATRVVPGNVDVATAAAVAASQLDRSFDPAWGGFGVAPKFPTPSRLLFLVDRATRGEQSSFRLVERTLDGMAAGGLWDWVGGGFHRYSVDERWLIPHFEKMLYDNALLARVYGEAGVRLDRPGWVDVARRTADYLLREMQGPEGGFYSSTDADSEGEEGRYFTWTADEVRAALPRDQADLAIAVFGLDGEANFEGGRHVLRPRTERGEMTTRFGTDEAGLATHLESVAAALLQARQARIPPLLDDKRLAGWNGMAIWSLGWLGAVLDEPAYVEGAARAADFLRRELIDKDGRIARSWRAGVRTGAETLEDLAWVAAGLVELYQSEGQVSHIRLALDLVRRRLPHYLDTGGALFESPDDGDRLPLRPRNSVDGATPASSAVLARTLVRLAALTGEEDLSEVAADVIRAEAAIIQRFAASATSLISAARELATPPSELVVVGDPSWPSTRALVASARRSPVAPLVTALSPELPVPTSVIEIVPLFRGRETSATARAVAFLCSGGACEQPTGDPQELSARLAILGRG